MDINALQVFNSMYKLGITQAEFKSIEEEIAHTERTGLSIKAVRKGYSICVLHDDKHKIAIKCIEGGRADSRILFKTLITFGNLPKEIYTLHQIAQYRISDNETRYTATNLEELKDRICDRFADGYPKELGCLDDDYQRHYCPEDVRKEIAREKQELVAKQMKALFWLFGENFDGFQGNQARQNIPRIIKVFSRNNRRVAVFEFNECYERTRGAYWNRYEEKVDQTTYKIKTYTPRDERYNYVAPNREVFVRDDAEIWIDDDLSEKLGAGELEVIAKRHREGGYLILNADRYNQMKSSVRLEMMSARRQEQEENARHQLAKRIKKQFKEGKVVRQGIEFSPKSISYGGVVFRGDLLGNFVVENNIILQEQPDFNTIFEGYIDYLLKVEVVRDWKYDVVREIVGFEGSTKLSVGKLSVKLEKVGNLFHIKVRGHKPHRINREDVSAVLKRAMSYANNPFGYDEFLTQTSKVNLKLQQALEDGGVKFVLGVDKRDDNPFTKAEKMLLTIPIRRENGRNYVKIGGREYKVKETKALFDLGKETEKWLPDGKLQRTIRLLYRAIDGITPQVIGQVIRQGQREYLKMTAKAREEEARKIKKSKEFLEHAVRLSGAVKKDGGYLVKGISGSRYFVDEELKVWTVKRNGEGRYVNDKYLCVIDVGTNTSTRWGENDAIAKRLLALAKDSVVADEIYRKGDRVDRWWGEIAHGSTMEGGVP